MTHFSTVFVTGAGGFIGRHLVRQLRHRQVNVVALMLPDEPVPESWGEQVRVVQGDVRQLASLASEVGPVDVIFHLAAVVSDWGAQQTHIDTTVHGTEQAIDLALQWDAHFVVTTSVCAYASELASGELDESSKLGKPASAYEYCKQRQEEVTLDAVAARELKATIVRPGNVYGVGSGPWVNMLVEQLRSKRPCLMGSGDWDAGLCHVENLVELLIAAAGSEHCRGDIFLAADGFGVTWNTYLQRLAQAAATEPPAAIPNTLARVLAPVLETAGRLLRQRQRPLITRQSFRLMGGANVFSINKAQRLLGYRPVVDFEQGMAEIATEFGSESGEANPQDWVWVTGSASGLGRYLTGQLLQRGYRVVATDLRLDALQQAAEQDHWPDSNVLLEQLDITEGPAWQALFEKFHQRNMGFSHLLNVAGFIQPGFLFEDSAQQTLRHLTINVMGAVNGCDTLLPHFRQRNQGHIINVASFAGIGPAPGVAAYCASKAAARSYSLGLGMDLALADSAVKVTCVCPDLIATPMMDKQVDYGDHSRLVFSGARALQVQEVGALILGKVWRHQPLEAALPRGREWLVRLLALSPAMALAIYRYLGSRGERNLADLRDRRVVADSDLH